MNDEFNPGRRLPSIAELSRRLRDARHTLDHWRNQSQRDDETYDEEAYLRLNEDVAEAVRSGKYASGYEHWRRHGWRERRQVRGAEPAAPSPAAQATCRSHVENAVSVEGRGILCHGWIVPNEIERCRVLCPETGESCDITQSLVRYQRPDVWSEFANQLGAGASDALGFFSFVPMPRASRTPGCQILLAVTPAGGVEQRGGPQHAHQPTALLETIKPMLSVLNPASTGFERGLTEHIGPALEALWNRERAHKPRKLTVQKFGSLPTRPRLSVIVPLYGRHDFLKYQLAEFANDPDFTDGTIELHYVVDDPRIIDATLQLAQNVAPQYRVPFGIAYTGHNHGYATSNNLGASIARAPLLVLLNSDVLPKHAQWATRLARYYDTLLACGVLGAKLLYPDGSIQHAGMAFERFPFWANMYGNNHPGKGLPSHDETSSAPREVDAVTGACMVVSSRLYRELGGLSEEFVLGDFEDSDFCLKAWAAKTRIWYAPSVELYHLERQSLPFLPGTESWRSHLTIFNCWLQNKKWAATIDELKKRSNKPAQPGLRKGNGA